MKPFKLYQVVMGCLLVVSCSGSGDSEQPGGNPTGTWVGDFGPAFYDRNTITLELKWDGRNLAGMISPGDPGGRMYRSFEGFAIENGSYDPATGTLKFEATFRPRDRRYVVEGRLTQNTLTGTWNRPAEVGRSGDFKLKRK